MRSVVVAAAVGVMAQTAYAADMPDYGPLRGALVETPRVINWEGFYVGGQGGYGTSDMNFTNATQGIVSDAVHDTVIAGFGVPGWPVLGKTSVHGQGIGGFLGYNAQWEDVVIGVEANYLHASFDQTVSNFPANSMTRCSPNSIIYSESNGNTHNICYGASGTMNVKDVGSVRARAGWAFGSFLPYMFGGVSLGRADIIRSATVIDSWTDSSGQNHRPVYSPTQIQNNHFIYGYAGGLGMDMMLYRGLFLRAEWEYLKFAAPIDTSVSTVRAGLGYKF